MPLPKVFLEHTPWEDEINPIWLATSFRLHRNLAKFNFPPKMNEQQVHQVSDLLQEKLLHSSFLESPVALKAEEISSVDKEYLFEHFLCLDGFQNALAGQRFIVDQRGHFFAKLNIDDHLQMQWIDSEGNWEKAWSTLNQIDTQMSSTLDFAFSSKFGYLTAAPLICGTALIAQAYLHLPALIHANQLQETMLKQKDEGIVATGMSGNLEELVGDIVIISNHYTLGVNEENILCSIHSIAMKLMAMEKGLRTHLQEEANGEMKDRLSRAFGLLLHSYQLQTKETLGALSLMKLGLSLGWIGGITDSKLNTLLFQCRRSHLLYALGDSQLTNPQEIAHKRAEFLHKNMQGVFLAPQAM